MISKISQIYNHNKARTTKKESVKLPTYGELKRRYSETIEFEDERAGDDKVDSYQKQTVDLGIQLSLKEKRAMKHQTVMINLTDQDEIEEQNIQIREKEELSTP